MSWARVVATLLVVSWLGAGRSVSAAYTLFNPVPEAELRPLAIDRPDITESPVTVDAGHFQFEGDVIRWNKESRNAKRSTLVIWSGLYKLGLTQSLDVQGGVEAYTIEQNTKGRTTDSGVGAAILRCKWNVYGNDGESRTALGVLPYVGAPAADLGYRSLQYGVGVPFSFALNERYSLGAQAQLDIIPDGDSHRPRFFQSLVLDGTLWGPLDFFVEGVAFFGAGPSQYLLDGGLVFSISSNVAVDVALNLGINAPAPTRAYLGLSFRV